MNISNRILIGIIVGLGALSPMCMHSARADTPQPAAISPAIPAAEPHPNPFGSNIEGAYRIGVNLYTPQYALIEFDKHVEATRNIKNPSALKQTDAVLDDQAKALRREELTAFTDALADLHAAGAPPSVSTGLNGAVKSLSAPLDTDFLDAVSKAAK